MCAGNLVLQVSTEWVFRICKVGKELQEKQGNKGRRKKVFVQRARKWKEPCSQSNNSLLSLLSLL